MTKKQKFFCTLIFLFTLLFFSETTNLFAQSKSTVTIENARKTSYYTEETSGDEIIIFTGGVEVSVKQGNDTTKITADTVHFNRTKNTLYAEGSVLMDRSSKGKTEAITADSLLLNVDSQEGIFNGGRVEQSGTDALNVPSGSSLIVDSDVFAKDDSGAIVFKKGALTFCDDPNPHWKIKGSRIWLLPGNEFAFANALLYVGHIPVMYFPFFYYPKDELVFNPVFGYQQREGYFVQTTTYVIGRKPLDKSDDNDSFLSFMKPTTQKKQQLEGLVLRNLDEDDKETYPNTLKVMADYYSNLGGMVGVSGVFKPEDSGISNLSFSAYLGMSRTLFPFAQDGISIYTPYSITGETYYNSAYLFGLKLPFRLKADFNLSIKSPFTLNLSLPIYTDPFFNSDFIAERKETMDWMDFLLNNSSETDESSETNTGELSSFSWTLSTAYNPSFSKVKPYINSLSFSTASSMLFSAKTDTTDLSVEEAETSPSRQFFYPSQIKPLSLSTKVAGTILSYPKVSAATKTIDVTPPQLNTPPDFSSKDKSLSEEEKNKTQQNGAEDSIENNSEISSEENTLQNLTLPLLKVSIPSATKINGLTYSLNYSVAPSLSTEMAYTAPETRSDFEWNDLKSTFVLFKSPIELSSNLGYRDSFLSLTNRIVFSPVVQRHPQYNEEAGRETALKNDYASQKMNITNANSLALKPFVYNPIFKNTSLSWNTNINLLRTKFTGTVDHPEWKYEVPSWDEESFSSHSLDFTLYAQEDDFYQKLVLSTNLPPKVDSYTGTLSLGFPFISVSATSGVKQKSATEEEWIFIPLTQNATLSAFDNKLKLTQSFSYDIEDKTPSNFNVTLSAFNLKLVYSMQYTKNYEYNNATGWKTTDEKDFQPISLTLNYNGNGKFNYFNDKLSIAPTLSTELSYNMQRPTSSYFVFTPGFTLKINNVLDLSFSTSSRNEVVYRYVQDYTDFEPRIPGETNIFKDLINSFAFGDDTKRESSGFKLKSLNIKLSHDLHDWKLTSEFQISPRIITENGLKRYDFSPKFTLSVLWKPMESIKTTIQDEYGTFMLNP